jgi:hypothetical protein
MTTHYHVHVFSRYDLDGESNSDLLGCDSYGTLDEALQRVTHAAEPLADDPEFDRDILLCVCNRGDGDCKLASRHIKQIIHPHQTPHQTLLPCPSRGDRGEPQHKTRGV